MQCISILIPTPPITPGNDKSQYWHELYPTNKLQYNYTSLYYMTKPNVIQIISKSHLTEPSEWQRVIVSI